MPYVPYLYSFRTLLFILRDMLSCWHTCCLCSAAVLKLTRLASRQLGACLPDPVTVCMQVLPRTSPYDKYHLWCIR